ncbi:hypothetical protein HNY73_018237 [Argiope bruennichi]|uniref:Uncharacterized protein n=1 Tax=Argiope bruennichi TaxID=94029 RepID=A0A8T0EGA5_ARGBR|nr:hypothetical protein HNY73_018237 [Argiope bruennichi]
MNSCGDDLLDLDFDPDVLIQLLGKLSLENIPSDISDTLSSLENRTDENECKNGANAQNCILSLNGENCQIESVSKKQDSDVLQGATASPNLHEDDKSNFLPVLGLVSDISEALCEHKRTESLLQCTASDNLNSLPNNLEHKENQNSSSDLSDDCSAAVQQQNKIKKDLKTSSYEVDDYKQNVPPWFSLDSVASKSFSYYPLFREQGKVFDIQLGDINNIKSELDKLPFLTSDNYQKSTHSDVAFNQECDSNDSSYDSLILPKQNFESASKSPTSLDSGYDTSSTISPSPPLLVNTKTSDSPEHFDETSDEELENIVATIVEVENSLLLLEASPSSANVPVLKDAKNEEDHKERLLNFLKEPASVDSVQVSVIVSSDENSSPLGTFEESFHRKVASALNLNTTKRSPHSSRKSPLKAKDRILGYELKYVSKNDNGHLVVFTKGKHFERNKILKQIQDDERRNQKKIKFIQIIDKRIKRTATDDRENNKKRRRLLSNKEEIQLKDVCLKCEH